MGHVWAMEKGFSEGLILLGDSKEFGTQRVDLRIARYAE